ncbi:chromosome segregation ATPase [Anaerosolibacter carboniphilus]|uniref:Chromosome segregation ATPase n=1 Tax=Anaerosolibacter carboniphilus TaxID=1417629 RepID=A0A841KVK3_9FIRM|nr:zinc ribbon domain-containing protein [Anaerosolibacter carboniphilus]MBB6216040.1 chromosome segregation ATPase [Anaerosolibacter carboniphilus]
MDFMEKLVSKVSEGTKVLSKKTDELLELTELKMEIKHLEDEIEEAKLFIGEMVYRSYLGKETGTAEMREKCSEIEQMYYKIQQLTQEVNEIRGVRLCPHCNIEIREYLNFCPSCGSKVV